MVKRIIKRILFPNLEKTVQYYTPPEDLAFFKAKYPDFSDFAINTFLSVRTRTMTSVERIESAVRSVEYVLNGGIEGDIVECGVWKGGTAMAMIKTLNHFHDTSRNIYLYDTYEGGMTAAGENDISFDKESGAEIVAAWEKNNAYPTLEEVKNYILSENYPADKIKFVQGDVMKTIPGTMPDKISILRLDTDWYDSTKHELEHLFPKVVSGGIVIIDDYGHWQGAKKAVDEYLKEKKINAFLSRIDYTGRLFIKN